MMYGKVKLIHASSYINDKYIFIKGAGHVETIKLSKE